MSIIKVKSVLIYSCRDQVFFLLISTHQIKIYSKVKLLRIINIHNGNFSFKNKLKKILK